jgi:hypothetical protein
MPSSSRNRKIGAIAVAVVALAGVGTAYAASKLHTSSGSHSATPGGGSFVAPARGQFGTPPSGNGYGRGFGGGRSGFGGGRGGFGGIFGSFTAATTYLGISQQQLFSNLQSGKTLSQIANSTSGKSASGLIAAMVTAQKRALDSAVKSGRITQAMATQIESNLMARVTDMVNNGFGGGRFGGRGGFGGGFGGGSGGNGFGSPPSAPTPSQGQAGASPT